MAWMNGCICGGWKRGAELRCDECSGENTRRSYHDRTGMLAGNLRVAALEELRHQTSAKRERQRLAQSLRARLGTVGGGALAVLREVIGAVEGSDV